MPNIFVLEQFIICCASSAEVKIEGVRHGKPKVGSVELPGIRKWKGLKFD
jgi:hypothetical protein